MLILRLHNQRKIAVLGRRVMHKEGTDSATGHRRSSCQPEARVHRAISRSV